MDRRFYCSPPGDATRVRLSGDEAQHLVRVLRARVGERVTLFDGSGVEYSAEITRLGRSDVDLKILAREVIDRELGFPLVIGVALPKGDRQRWLVEKAVELGVTSLVPLHTRRGVAQPTAAALERLRRYVVEGAKQCGRNRLMQIEDARAFDEFCQMMDENWQRLLAHPSESETEANSIAQPFDNASPGVAIAVGPEGGFTEDEVATATGLGWRAVSLGPRILRVETAAVALAALAAFRVPRP